MGCASSISIDATEKIKVSKDLFVLNGLIGEGGFGKVFTALFVKNQQWYALKEINKSKLMKHRTGATMLQGELDAMKRIQHTFVVSLHFAFQDRSSCYFVMDLRCGGDLRYYLKKKLVFEERDVAFYIACLSSALDHIHSLNIIHRDIKPENIILDEKGYPHLTDFGVAHVQSVENFTMPLASTLASGTKQYLAPEVFTKTHIHGPEADFWSLGVVAYELLFGRRPFEKHVPNSFIKYLDKALAAKQSALNRTREKLHSCKIVLKCPGHEEVRYTSEAIVSASSQSTQYSATLIESPLRSSSICCSGETSPARDGQSNCSSPPFTNSLDSIPPKIFGGIAIMGEERIDSDSTAISMFRRSDHSLFNENDLESFRTPPKHTIKRQKECINTAMMSHTNSMNEINLEISQKLSTNQYSKTQEHRAAPGDHWLVEDGKLPITLTVLIPIATPWIGNISSDCINMLNGLFDVRPSHRYGARNMDNIRYHSWLQSLNLNEKDLVNRKISASFVPGKRFLQETYANSVARLHELEMGKVCSWAADLDELDQTFVDDALSQNFDFYDYVSPFNKIYLENNY